MSVNCKSDANNDQSQASVSKFPSKLHFILQELKKDGLEDLASWQPHGRCFIVHKPKEFEAQILPFYFQQSRFTSFQRQLSFYGFRRITTGMDKGGYHHEFFLRGQEDLANRIVRTKIKGTGPRKSSALDSPTPNFYEMTPLAQSRKSQPEPLRLDDAASVASKTLSSGFNQASIITPSPSAVQFAELGTNAARLPDEDVSRMPKKAQFKAFSPLEHLSQDYSLYAASSYLPTFSQYRQRNMSSPMDNYMMQATQSNSFGNLMNAQNLARRTESFLPTFGDSRANTNSHLLRIIQAAQVVAHQSIDNMSIHHQQSLLHQQMQQSSLDAVASAQSRSQLLQLLNQTGGNY